MSLYHRLHGQDDSPSPAADTRSSKIVTVRNEVHARLIDELGPEVANESDLKEMRKLVGAAVERVLSTIRTPLSVVERKQLIDDLIDDIVGYGPLDVLLRDETVSDILVNGPHSVYVEKEGVLVKSDVTFADTEQLRRVIDKIVSEVGRRIDESSPLCDARLNDGSRVNAIISPLTSDGPYMTIRKFTAEHMTINHLIDFGSLTVAAARFLQACVLARLNIIVAGGSGSGKTTTLNVLSSFFPEDERIVTIEDAKELELPQDHVLALESRPPNVEGTGEVRIRELVKNSLRMRPDRIVVGECRGGEALDMLQAMNTGHDGSLTTVHANGPDEALSRLETLVLMAGYDLPVKAIRDQLSSAVDLMVQMTRLRDGTRKVTQITEIRGLDVQQNIITEDIYVFDTGMGWADDGKHRGRLKATGVEPRFSQKFADFGITLPDDTFKAEQITRRIQPARVFAEEVVEGDISSERARRALTAGNIGSYTKVIPTRYLLEEGLLEFVFNQVDGTGADSIISWANDRLLDFLFAYTAEPDAVEAWLIETSLGLGEPGKMLMSHTRARCAGIVARLVGAQQVLDVGTFTGYSAMTVARAIEHTGKVLTLDVNKEWTAIAREAWEKMGVAQQIELKLGPAIETIKALPEDPIFDMVILDADEESYIDYHEAVLPRLKPGGVILVDDTLMEGRVIVPDGNKAAEALKAYAIHALQDDRVRGAMLPVAEGMLLLQKHATARAIGPGSAS